MYHYYYSNPMSFANTGIVIKVIANSDVERLLTKWKRITRKEAEQHNHCSAKKITEAYLNRDGIVVYRYPDGNEL